MFDTLADVPQLGVALGVVSLTMFGIVTDLPEAPAPDATAAGATVDRAAATSHPTTASHPLAAQAVKIGPHEIALRNGGGTAHAAFAYGPVTPVPDSGALRRVLRGAPPSREFESPSAFERAARGRQNRSPRWQSAGEKLLVRHVTWGDVNVTLVGA
ncbi:MAG: hypothetical protein ABEJ68_06205 [Halobacteriaceae archaeon]